MGPCLGKGQVDEQSRLKNLKLQIGHLTLIVQ